MRCDRKTLSVRVNDELTLDAGCWEERAENGVVQRYIHPPKRTMFEQVIDYLESLPSVPGYPGMQIGREAIAATAVCLRWGSYLAVLADRDKPLWSQVGQPGLSRISDSEMARINVEASAAMAQWIEIMRDNWEHYLTLTWATHRLPMTRRSVPTNQELPFLRLTHPSATAALTESISGERHARARTETQAYPSRVLANAFINACWRNGPIESIHAGRTSTPPLLQRRIKPSEERLLISSTAGHLAQAILAVFELAHAQNVRNWSECVLPFHLISWIRPRNWSLQEQTRPVWLPGAEPSLTD